MKEFECIENLKKIAKMLLENTGILEIIKLDESNDIQVILPEIQRPDFILNVRTKDKEQYSLVFEVKSIGQPRYIRMAVNQLRALISQRQNMYGVIGAPYLSEESRRICLENDIGFIDISGNCLIKFNNIYIEVQGKPNAYPTTRPLKSLFAPKSTRALRMLLSDPRKEWNVNNLAKDANISLGQASNIKKKLLDYELIQEKNKKFQIVNPENLLNKWAESYTYHKNRMRNFYSFDVVKEIERKLINYCESNKIQYAFTLTSGASLVAPFLRYNRVFVYIKDSLEKIILALGLKEVSSGPNISILEPYDEGVFYGIQDINGAKVVSDVQLYLDLQGYRGRGEEAAQFLMQRRLRKPW